MNHERSHGHVDPGSPRIAPDGRGFLRLRRHDVDLCLAEPGGLHDHLSFAITTGARSGSGAIQSAPSMLRCVFSRGQACTPCLSMLYQGALVGQALQRGTRTPPLRTMTTDISGIYEAAWGTSMYADTPAYPLFWLNSDATQQQCAPIQHQLSYHISA